MSCSAGDESLTWWDGGRKDGSELAMSKKVWNVGIAKAAPRAPTPD